MNLRNRVIWPLLALVVLALVPAQLSATNGMYLTGYSAETIGRGGANLAISDRSLALNFNPAGISQLQGNHFTLNLSVLAPTLEFENMVNTPVDGDSRYFPLPSLAYVRGSKDSPWTWGVGFVAQGGMGGTFRPVNTFFGTQDELYSQVAFMTLTPTVSYAVNDDMAFGLAVNLGYGDASFRFFPGTSFFNMDNPMMSFPGVKMENAGGFQWNVRGGWWWRPTPKFSMGLIYQTETESTFKDGDLWVNYTNFPFIGERVKYTADMEGFAFAAQAGIGFALRPNDRWVLALDIKRYYWDDAMDTILVTGKNPSPAVPPPFDEVQLPFVFDWEDQWVIAIGGDYRLNDRWTLRGGYNHGDNPVPADTLTPLFPATVEDHLTFGFGFLAGSITYDFAIEHAFNNSQTNNNPDPMVNPFGPGSRVDHSQWTVSFGVSWAWAR
jgi:long-chain fatty acid transport protein